MRSPTRVPAAEANVPREGLSYTVAGNCPQIRKTWLAAGLRLVILVVGSTGIEPDESHNPVLYPQRVADDLPDHPVGIRDRDLIYSASEGSTKHC